MNYDLLSSIKMADSRLPKNLNILILDVSVFLSFRAIGETNCTTMFLLSQEKSANWASKWQL